MSEHEQYKEYVRLQELADNIYRCSGDCEEYHKAQIKADCAYEGWEYAAGIQFYD